MRILFLLVCVSVVSPLFPTFAAEKNSWVETSFDDFADGTFTDAGANMYVSAKGRIGTINRWDVNGDGYIDLFCVNTHPLVEMLDMSIYWGDGKDFSIKNHTYVPADGPMWAAAGDLNGDGAVDLVLANYSNGTWTKMDSAVYWGGLGKPADKATSDEWTSYPFKGKTLVPGRNTQGLALSDLNNDGRLDIIYAFGAGFWEYKPKIPPKEQPCLRIYWNVDGDFQRDTFTELPAMGATDVAAADFDKDGWVDLVCANGEGDVSFIYYNSPSGFSEQARAELPTVAPHKVEAADLDNDGNTDIVFANENGEVSYGYINSGGTFSSDRQIKFETYMAKDVLVADFNKDGLSDVFFSNHQQSWAGQKRMGNRVIDSFLYYGSQDGFSARNRASLQTIGAWGASAADLNGDGWIDLVISSFQEAYSFDVPSFVYWNGPDGFDVTRRTPLYEHGAQGNVIADFNGDGHLDILFTNMMGNSRGDYDPSYLYFGNREGKYNTNDRISLPGREPYEQGFSDLDDDGDVDILVANQGETYRYENEVWIYWNEKNTFDSWDVTGVPGFKCVGVEIADLDRDGYLDLVLPSNGNYKKGDDAPVAPGSFIYWGSLGGWVVCDRTVLNVSMCRSPSIADLNGDGHLDLVFAGPGASIFWGDGTRNYSDARRQKIPDTYGRLSTQTEVADLNKDGVLDIVFAGNKVLIYFGDQNRAYDKKTELAVSAKTAGIADVNNDGWLDIVCPVYTDMEHGRRTTESFVMLGGAEGFREDNRIALTADGGTGSIVSDFNFDGYPDVFLFCHRKDGSPDEVGRFGDHHTDSRLFWGSAQGFNSDNYLPVPSIGAHYDMGVDLGNIRDRSFLFEYESSPRDCQDHVPDRIRWDAALPPNTRLRFQLRSAAAQEDLARAGWLGPAGKDSFYETSDAAIQDLPKGNWLQYRAVFDAGNGASSPILDTIEIIFK